MQNIKTFSGNNETDIWTQVAEDMGSTGLLDYQVQINQGGHLVNIVVDIDLGGGFEGGFEMTEFSASLGAESEYKFAIHNEDFLDEIGKFFGMQDVALGYAEFDKKVIVKTNNDDTTRKLFAGHPLQTFINEIGTNFNLAITGSGHDRKLEMTLEKGVTDVHALQKMYGFFYGLLIQIEIPA